MLCPNEYDPVCYVTSYNMYSSNKNHISLFCVSVRQAQKKFLECIAAQQEWRQIHHLCYWELMWSYSFQQDWLEAYQYADLLCKESKWSQV